MQIQKTTISAYATIPDEDILVVKRSLLFGQNQFQGLLQASVDDYLRRITQYQEFLPRSIMEQDPTYKQIIPYLIFKHQNRYFLMQRRASASEQRLKNKFTLGIGGHVRKEDLTNKSSIFEWAEREFHEEIHYTGSFSISTLGLLNDDSNEVGKVHVGLVLLLEGNSSNIAIKSELKQGNLVTLEECCVNYDHLESWSQIVVDYLRKK